MVPKNFLIIPTLTSAVYVSLGFCYDKISNKFIIIDACNDNNSSLINLLLMDVNSNLNVSFISGEGPSACIVNLGSDSTTFPSLSYYLNIIWTDGTTSFVSIISSFRFTFFRSLCSL